MELLNCVKCNQKGAVTSHSILEFPVSVDQLHQCVRQILTFREKNVDNYNTSAQTFRSVEYININIEHITVKVRTLSRIHLDVKQTTYVSYYEPSNTCCTQAHVFLNAVYNHSLRVYVEQTNFFSMRFNRFHTNQQLFKSCTAVMRIISYKRIVYAASTQPDCVQGCLFQTQWGCFFLFIQWLNTHAIFHTLLSSDTVDFYA